MWLEKCTVEEVAPRGGRASQRAWPAAAARAGPPTPPCTLYPTPYTLHPEPYTLHPTLYTEIRPKRARRKALCGSRIYITYIYM